MKIRPLYTIEDDHPLAPILFVKRSSRIVNPDGSTVFQMEDIEVPEHWSQTAIDILAQKYFKKRGVPSATVPVPETGIPDWLLRHVPAEGATFGSETKAHQVFHRLAGCWAYWGFKEGYFGQISNEIKGNKKKSAKWLEAERNARNFYNEVIFLLAAQYFAPNSPQWFNTGIHWAYGIIGEPQGHWFFDPKLGKAVLSPNAYEHIQAHACVAEGEPVLTNEGPIPIEKVVARIKEGDSELVAIGPALTPDNKILDAASTGTKLVFKLTTESGVTVRLTEDHLVIVRGCTKQVNELQAGIDELDTSAIGEDGSTKRTMLIDISEDGISECYNLKTSSGLFWAGTGRAVLVHNCFLLSVKDDLVNSGGIMDTWVRESRIFKLGSGSGTNVSAIRGEKEPLSGGGRSSGLMSFLPIGDRAAGSIKSGGVTRRAAVMRTLDDDHPDLDQFINWKVEEEIKVAELVAGSKLLAQFVETASKAIKEGKVDEAMLASIVRDAKKAGLIPAQYINRIAQMIRMKIIPKPVKVMDVEWEGPAYQTVSGQNSNNSVRATHNFMRSVLNNGNHNLYWRTEKKKASEENRQPKPCIRRGQPIWTSQGWRPINELDGQECAIYDGIRFSPAKIWRVGKKPIVRLHAHNGRTIDLTPDHLVYCRWKETKDGIETNDSGWVEAKDTTGKEAMIIRQGVVSSSGMPSAIREWSNIDNVEDLKLEDDVYDFKCESSAGVVATFYVHNCDTVPARNVWNQMNLASWCSGDPGIHFSDTMNEWHTTPEDGPINTTNPCQPGFATVLTKDGITRFDDIEEGSVIWSGKRWTKVTRKIKTGKKPVYRYYTTAGTFVGTKEHKVISFGERIMVSEAKAIDIATGPVTGPAIDQNVMSFDYQVVIDGMTLGDGGLKISNGGVDIYKLIYVGDKDKWYFDDHGIKDFISKKKFDGKAHRVRTNLTNEELSRKAYERSVPDRYRFGSRLTVRSFLRGLYDANGSVCGERVTLKSSSIEIILHVQEMLSSIGIRSYYTTNKEQDVKFDNGIYQCRESYDLNITADRLKFKALIGFGNPDRTKRLQEICGNCTEKPRKHSYSVFAVEHIGNFDVYDITVDDKEHTYWTGGLLVSNCSEYLSVDDSGCNLASTNLLRFHVPAVPKDLQRRTFSFAGKSLVDFDVDGFCHVVELVTLILEITVTMAHYPSQEIAVNSYNLRQLGLGYTNLGSLIMAMGYAYDSPEARGLAACITAIMHGSAAITSSNIAADIGPFPNWSKNSKHMLRVMKNHATAATDEIRQDGSRKLSYDGISDEVLPVPLSAHKNNELFLSEAKQQLEHAVACGKKHGYRNAQLTLLAPTGTISLTMDADTTGCEPDFALVKFKKLAGGGYMKLVNKTTELALQRLGYRPDEIKGIVEYATGHGTFDGCPFLNTEVLKEMGLNEKTIETLEASSRGAFDVRFIFNQVTIGPEEIEKIVDYANQKFGKKIAKQKLSSPGFDLLGELFSNEQIEAINTYVCGTMTVEGAPGLKPEHLPVFDCANRCGKHGKRFLEPIAHIKMLAAVQPFLSGGISKTINLPSEITPEEIGELRIYGWKHGLKCVADFRDGSKLSQPLSTSASDAEIEAFVADATSDVDKVFSNKAVVKTVRQVITRYLAERRKLPDRRSGYTQKVRLGGHTIYMRTGEYEDGTLGEIFIDMAKAGAAFRAMANSFAIAISLGLQHGVPLEEYVDAFLFTRFDPCGSVEHHDRIRMSTSLPDFVFRDLAINYLGRSDLAHVTQTESENSMPLSVSESPGSVSGAMMDVATETVNGSSGIEATAVAVQPTEIDSMRKRSILQGFTGDPCNECGQLTLVRNGTCLRCQTCGASTGCV